MPNDQNIQISGINLLILVIYVNFESMVWFIMRCAMDFFAFFTIIHGIDTEDKIILCRIMV